MVLTFKPPCSGGEPDLNADILGDGRASDRISKVWLTPKAGRLMPKISHVWPPLLPSPIT